MGAHGDAGADRLGDLADGLVLAVEVAREGVDRDDRRHTVDLDVLDLLDEVGCAGAHVVGVLGEQLGRQRLAGDDLELAAVGLQRPNGRHQHGRVGDHARVAALDVEEALGAHVGAEAGLGDEVVAAVDADRGRR